MPPVTHISDFPDKLNPMLVKELRQGLRGISFIVLFIGIQAFLCFILLITTAVASHENSGHLLSRIIFFFFSLAVIVVQPLRGISALHAEIKGNTIDLLCLTRLSAWRITYGKWISIVGQSALILTAVTPYLILRYFFGDMNIFSETLLLFSLFLISAMLTAFTVGLSAMSSAIIRVLLPIMGAGLLFIMIWVMFFTGGRDAFQFLLKQVTLDSANTTFTWLGFVIACIYTTWMCLDIGTSLIAPIAENRSTLRRLVSLGLITATLIALGLAKASQDVAVMISIILCIPIVTISLTEKANLVQPIVAPFIRKGIKGRIAGILLYPGWATGLIFCLLLYAIILCLLKFNPISGVSISDADLMIMNTTFALLLFPLALTRLFARKNENRFGLFLLFTCSQFLIIGILNAAELWSHGLKLMQYFFWIPPSTIFLDDSHGFSTTAILNVSYINIILYTLIPLATTLPVWEHIRDVERTCTGDS